MQGDIGEESFKRQAALQGSTDVVLPYPGLQQNMNFFLEKHGLHLNGLSFNVQQYII